jgi:hypothetical protein
MTLTLPSGIVADASGNLLITDSRQILKLSSDGTVTLVSVTPQTALSLALDAGGSLYVSEGYLSGYAFGGAAGVRKVAADGTSNAIAGNGIAGYSGDDGPATAASFSAAAAGIAVDRTGAVYVADAFNNVIRILRPVSK